MSGALAKIEHWEKEIEKIKAGDTNVSLGRAKEMLSHARWRAEREFPQQWGGHKININVVGNVNMTEALGEEANKLLDKLTEKEV